MGNNTSITCHSDTQAEKIEWLSYENEVLFFLEMSQELILPLNPVNDSIHGKTYTCRVTRNGDEVAEQNFTVNVKGKEQQFHNY